jgi:hypothetical protein
VEGGEVMKKRLLTVIAIVMLLPAIAFAGWFFASVSGGGGENLLTNGDFATLDTTGWTANNGTFDASSGACAMTNTAYGYLRQDGVTTSAQSYHIAFDVSGYSASSTYFQSGTTSKVTITGDGSYSSDFTANSTYIKFYFNNAAAGQTMTIDNVVLTAN